ncbi:hypothetical protein K7X08_026911 [Anisodus acutangulus]|uniref:Uncharacterized protein n=1 Tax=Anisodus acutangulus TaxID=402998 RepID=A0A9Q1QZL9_9SOLA|nr:hypothetical protein K7X08_026911 [Anisodus acutangulus]
MVEILEVAMELLLVEIKVVNGGLEYDDYQWEELKLGMKDIIVSWKHFLRVSSFPELDTYGGQLLDGFQWEVVQ